jgi:hypothetical protein
MVTVTESCQLPGPELVKTRGVKQADAQVLSNTAVKKDPIEGSLYNY